MRIIPNIGRLALYAALGSWAGCSIVRQIDPKSRHMQRLDMWGLTIPNYRFFGPIPSIHDTNLLIRFHLDDGRAGPWQELVCREERRLVHMLWAPKRRMNKALFDVQLELLTVLGITHDIRRISGSIPYRALLNVAVRGVEHPSDARAAQFAIGRSAGHDDSVVPEIVFASDVHELSPARSSPSAAPPSPARKSPAKV